MAGIFYCANKGRKSDVEVAGDGGSVWHCEACTLLEGGARYNCFARADMLDHLDTHTLAGHKVPQHAIDVLKALDEVTAFANGKAGRIARPSKIVALPGDAITSLAISYHGTRTVTLGKTGVEIVCRNNRQSTLLAQMIEEFAVALVDTDEDPELTVDQAIERSQTRGAVVSVPFTRAVWDALYERCTDCQEVWIGDRHVTEMKGERGQTWRVHVLHISGSSVW